MYTIHFVHHVLDVFRRDVVFLNDLLNFADRVGTDMSTGTDLPSRHATFN